MKNLNYLDCNELEELDKIINSKQQRTRTRLTSIIKRIEVKYELYLNDFENIHKIPPNDFDTNESNDLQGCYTIKTNAKDELIKNIISAQSKHFQNVCGYCLINTRNTIDHYIPETSLPVFSILAKNLLPCCNFCNQKKLEYWREGNSRAIIHLYNDFNLDIQFLYGSLSFNKHGVPLINFELRNDNKILNSDYNIIEKHFTRLDLLNRYMENIDLIISDIKDDIEINRLEFGDLITNEKIKSILIRKSQKLVDHFGVNYWKAIVINLLANSKMFLDSI